MRLSHPLGVITPTIDGEVLAVLAGANHEFTRPQIQKMLDAYTVPGIRKVLDRLVNQGIVLEEQRGSTATFRLNRDHLAADAIIELASLRSRFIDRLHEAITSLPTPPIFAALFGSAARNDMRLDSDIDLFIVRPDDIDDRDSWDESLLALTHTASRWVGNDVRILEMSASEVVENFDDPVLDSIRVEGITLAGRTSYWKVAARG